MSADCSQSLVLFYVTVPHTETGTQIAKQLMSKKWIACANVLPAHVAVYEWEGKVVEDSEHVLILKTHPEHATKVEAEIIKMHPYDCPCILQIKPSQANAPFLEWVNQQTRT